VTVFGDKELSDADLSRDRDSAKRRSRRRRRMVPSGCFDRAILLLDNAQLVVGRRDLTGRHQVWV
jgi:hypothetical protein